MDNHRFLSYCCRLCYLLVFLASCASSRNATIQNTTARFNVLYNAERLLNTYLDTKEAFADDDFNELLPIFRNVAPNQDTKVLDSVIHKANIIIREKSESKYVDDAYFLIAEANFLKGNFYDAAEFYHYVYTTYPKETKLARLARAKKALTLLALHNPGGASAVLDSATKESDESEGISSEALAVKAQLLMSQNRTEEAEKALTRALSDTHSKDRTQRWMFVLARLQEKNNNKNAALETYKSLPKGFTTSELVFHADINRARLSSELQGNEADDLTILETFLEKDQYQAYGDRIHYMIGKMQEKKGMLDDALASYKNSIRASSSNRTQKGISYMALAEGYFTKEYYRAAEAYYDSALLSLPNFHPQYELINEKAFKIKQVADLLDSLHYEETLGRIAKLPEDERHNAISEVIRVQNLQEPELAGWDLHVGKAQEPVNSSAFYFNNSKALYQGELDFQAKWGDRPLRDNWRYQQTGAPANDPGEQNASFRSTQRQQNNLSSGANRRFADYLDNLPLTADAIRSSEERIAGTLYELGLIYLNKLQDEELATATFEKLIRRFPESSYALPAYYNLYLCKRRTDPQTSKEYEEIILTKYSDSEIAHTIRAARGASANEPMSGSDRTYSHIYSLYANKQYENVIDQVHTARINKTAEVYGAQLDYLYTIALGYSQSPRSFEDSLLAFTRKYPQDSLITPLVRQHLHYINSNRTTFSQRQVALVKNEVSRFEDEPVDGSWSSTTPDFPAPVSGPVIPDKPKLQNENSPGKRENIEASNVAKPHYFVVNVFSAITNLAPSRFGIGQFNRSLYPGLGIKHQLKVVNKENQLIFVGPFQNKEEVSMYEARILPMMKEIMKIPAERYNTFVVSAEEFEQLNTREQIQSYIEAIKKIK